MAIFCIPKHLVEKLKNSALKGEVDIRRLYDMSSAERRAFFTEYTNTELGRFINVEFEKAMISKQKDALLEWAQSVFTPKAKEKPAYKTILDKINSLDEMGVLNPESEKAFLQDLVADKLGITVSAEEVKAIASRATKIDEAQAALGNDLGSPAKMEENMAFFKAKKEMDDYLNSLVPTSNLKVFTSTIGRGMMLASIKSPILNIESNTVAGISEAFVRRLSRGQVKGADNNLALEYVKFVNKVYKETGYDVSRMRTLSDQGTSGARVLGDIVTSQGKGPVRAFGRVVEDVVFKRLLGGPDAAFSSVQFADSVNLGSLKLAKGNKVKAKEIMADAMRLKPQTAEGEVLRGQAILDAETATWTNDSWATKITLGIRKLVNEASGDLRLGDQFFPFIKTPANVIETGLDYAGMGIPKALIDTVKVFRKARKTNTPLSEAFRDEAYLRKLTTDVVRAGFGMTAALLIANTLNENDYMGAYDPARKQIESLRNSTENSIRFGGKWVSTDYLGPLSVGVNAIMYARKYGKGGFIDGLAKFGQGEIGTFMMLPGVQETVDAVKSYQNNGQFINFSGAGDAITGWIAARTIPSILSDVAKMTDQYERKAGKGLESVQAKIPGMRQKLPIKRNILGEELKTEPWFSTLLFGSRMKTDKETAIVKELSNVQNETQKTLNFTDWDKTTSKQLAQFKEKLGEYEYEQGKIRYGYWIKTEMEKMIKDPKYQNMTADEKADLLNSLDTAAMEKTFRQFGFKYQAEKKKKAIAPYKIQMK